MKSRPSDEGLGYNPLNMRRTRAAALLGVVWLGVAAAAGAANQSIDVGPSIAFTPNDVTVAPGESVTWNWQGGPHSSTSNATSGPEFWDSDIQLLGATFSHTFNTPGDYPFYCKVHSCPTCTFMNGVVHVVAAATATPLPTATPTPIPGQTLPVPALSRGASALFALILAAAALLVLTLVRPR